MDLRQLEMFKAIVDTGSFTKAGEKLFVSQSAVSRQIKLLEEELGEPVFQRTPKKVHLTEAGQLVLQYCNRVFNEIGLLKSEVSDLSELRRGTVRLGGGMSVCTYLYPTLLKKYHQRYPMVDVSISTGTNDEILKQMREHEVDLALLSLPFHDPDLEVGRAVREEMLLILPQDHPLARQDGPVPFESLPESPFIHFERGSNTRQLIDEIFREREIWPPKTMEIQNVEITKALVEIGLGLSIVPYPAIALAGKKRRLAVRRLVGPRIYREMGWVHLKSDYMSHAMRNMLELFEDIRDRWEKLEAR